MSDPLVVLLLPLVRIVCSAPSCTSLPAFLLSTYTVSRACDTFIAHGSWFFALTVPVQGATDTRFTESGRRSAHGTTTSSRCRQAACTPPTLPASAGLTIWCGSCRGARPQAAAQCAAMGGACCDMAVPTTMPIPLVRPSLHSQQGSRATQSSWAGFREARGARLPAPHNDLPTSVQTAHTARSAHSARSAPAAPEHEACAGGEVLGALQEAEAHAGAVPRAQALAVHGHHLGCLPHNLTVDDGLQCGCGCGYGGGEGTSLVAQTNGLVRWLEKEQLAGLAVLVPVQSRPGNTPGTRCAAHPQPQPPTRAPTLRPPGILARW